MTKAAPEESLEDFESYPSYSTKLNGFTLLDADGGFPAGLQEVDMPIMNQVQSFWTIGNDVLPFMSTLGKTSLATMASVNADGRPVRNDDWLISPELYGGRQTISFWACSQTVDYGNETFEVYASSTGNALSDFSKVLYETEVGDTWTQFFVTLSAGSRYFAIRCTSDDRMIFTLDDITYIAKGTPRTLDFQGYNVYRNGVMLNSEPVTATTFSTSRDLERDDYFVTAVYAQGESTASNVVSLGEVGIEGVEADSASAAEPIYFDLHGLRVNPAALTPGIYLRRQGTVTEKVIIR